MPCPHGKRKDRCRDCGGKGFCQHNRRPNTCRDCGGVSICEHNRNKYRCKECGGKGICEHNREKKNCKDCKGSGICEHNKERSHCKECKGASICEHSKKRSRCKECKGASICQHSRIRSACKDCGGASICEHKKIRLKCKDCGGTSICIHNIIRYNCKDCLTLEQRLASGRFCKVCTIKKLSTQRIRAKIELCATCDIEYPQRIEHVIRPLIIKGVNHPISTADDRTAPLGCNGVKSFPDLSWYDKSVCIIVEIDEKGGHPDNLPSCELARMTNINESLKTLLGEQIVVHFIRFNPDEYDGRRISLDARCALLCKEINNLLTMPTSTSINAIHVNYMFYHKKCKFQIDAAKAQPEVFIIHETV